MSCGLKTLVIHPTLWRSLTKTQEDICPEGSVVSILRRRGKYMCRINDFVIAQVVWVIVSHDQIRLTFCDSCDEKKNCSFILIKIEKGRRRTGGENVTLNYDEKKRMWNSKVVQRMLFIITDKTRTIGEYVNRVSVWWEKKSWRWKMRHTKWIGGREHRRRRRWIEARGLWVGGVSVCAWSYMRAIDVKVDTQDCDLGEDVAHLRVEGCV